MTIQQISGFLGDKVCGKWGRRPDLDEEKKEFSGVTEMLYIFTLVMVLWVYTSVKMYTYI